MRLRQTRAVQVLPVLAILAFAGASIFVVLGPPVAMAEARRWPLAAVAAWGGALLLLGASLMATYRSGVQADADGSTRNALSDWWWLATAAGCAALAVAVARRRSP